MSTETGYFQFQLCPVCALAPALAIPGIGEVVAVVVAVVVTAVVVGYVGHEVYKAVTKGGDRKRDVSHTVKHNSKKRAKDAATAKSSKGQQPLHETAKNGNPGHYHPVDSNGKRRVPNIHHDYPGA